jgi:dihydropyrimidine dehydrogenase (NADP+)
MSTVYIDSTDPSSRCQETDPYYQERTMSAPIPDIEDFFRNSRYTVNPRLTQSSLLRPTQETKKLSMQFKRHLKKNTLPHELLNDFSLSIHTHLTEEEAVQEAARCLKCADAPCRKGCPTNIDVKAFITCIQSRNFYGAAQMILNQNPMGYTCGTLCMTSELCGGCCNLANTRAGSINISGLQEFAMQRYAAMRVPARVDPHVPPHLDARIALIGAGPASLSCATFLARLGYTHVTIFERQSFVGGLGSLEISRFRLPQQAVVWEVEQVQQLGVHFRLGQELGRDVTVQSLLEQDGYHAVFVGAGKVAPKTIEAFQGLTPRQGYYHSKEFLLNVSLASKSLPQTGAAPALSGRVLVLGGGDVATDCARSAFRLGADRVTLCLRRNVSHFRATPEEVA